MTTDMTPDNDGRLALEQALASPEAVLATARLPEAPEHFFEQVRVRYGAELMLEACLEALFSPQSQFLQGGFRQLVLLGRKDLPAFQKVLDQRQDPVAAARLHLVTGRGTRLGQNRILWRGHPDDVMRQYFKAHPPAPGELGPTLAPLMQYLNNGRSATFNLGNQRFETALGMVHQLATDYTFDPDTLLEGSLLQLLGDQRYDQDLLYPVDDHSCLMDHVPNLMAHMRAYCQDKTQALPKGKTAMSTKLDQLQAKIDRNQERILNEAGARAARAGQPDDERDTPVPGDDMGVL